MISLIVSFSTLGLTLRSAGGPAERALLGFPEGFYQPAWTWWTAPGFWMGASVGWKGERLDTLVLLDDPSIDPDSVPFEIPIRLPLTTHLDATGGVSFVGGAISTRWGMMGVGAGGRLGNTLALEGSSRQVLTLDVTFEDTLTHQDIPDLDPQERIPVSVRLQGDLELTLTGDVSLGESRTPFFLHLVREKPWGSWGVGLLLEDVRIHGRGRAGVGLDASATTRASAVVDTTTGWSLVGNFAGAFQDSTLFAVSVTGELRAFQPSLGVGALRRFSLWHLRGAVDAGLWATLPVDASGDLRVRVLVPTSEPADVAWNWDSLQVDTTARVIQGGGTIQMGALKDTVVDLVHETGTFHLSGVWGGRLGLSLGVGRVDVALSGAFTGQGGSLERTDLLADLGLNFQIFSLHGMGGLVSARTHLGEVSTGWLPMAYGGLRLAFRVARLDVRTGLLYQSSQAAFQFLSREGSLSRPMWLLAVGYRM